MLDLLSPKTIKELLTKNSAAPLKRLGQNFLINRGVLQKIIEAADLDRKDVILEIGPGLGTLTQELARRVKKVIAIEKDRKFVETLKETMKEYKNVKIIEGDILEFPISNFQFPNKSQISNFKFPKKYKLIANLPYYITSPVIRKFLEEKNRPEEMLLMVQKEVAQRICALPVRSSAKRSEGGRMSLLAVSVQFYAEPKIISYVSSGSFWPPPKVDSAILRIIPYSDPNLRIHPNAPNKNSDNSDVRQQADSDYSDRLNVFRTFFFRVVKAGFSAPRKQLAGNLAKGLKIERSMIETALKKTGIEPSRRAETLSVEEWMVLTKSLSSTVKR